MIKDKPSLILDICKQICSQPDKVGLLTAIHDLVMPVFSVEATGLFIVDEAADYHYDVTVENPGIDGSPQNEMLYNSLGFEKMPHKGTAIDYIFKQLKQKEKPLMYEFAKLFKRHPRPFSTIIIESGGKETYAALLTVSNEPFGIFFLNSNENGKLATIDAELFQQVADMVAISLSNILAKEDIQRREQEKTVLLSISESISKAKNTVELLAAIKEKVNQLLPFYDTGILIVEPNGEYHYDMAVNFSGWDNSLGNNKLLEEGLTRIKHKGSYVDVVMQEIEAANSPLIEDYEKRFLEFDYPFFKYLNEFGYKEGIVTQLRSSGKSIGTFWLNSLTKNHFSKAQFPLFQAVAEQVSVAVANILSKEEILGREKEKSILLEITEALSKSNNRSDVLQAIFHHVSKLFNYDGSGLFMINIEEDYHQLLIHSETINDSTLPIGTQDKIPYHSSAAEWMAGDFDIHLLKDIKKKFPGHPHYPDLEALGIQQMIHGPLLANGKTIGMFCLNSKLADGFNKKSLVLFRHVSEQISIAVANILANEEIAGREKEKTSLLSISQKLATIRDKKNLFEVIFKEVKPIFLFDTATVVFFDESLANTRHFSSAYDKEYSHNKNYNIIMSDQVPTKGSPHGEFIDYKKSTILSLDYLLQKYPNHLGVKIMKDFDLKKCVIMPLRYGGKLLATFEMFSHTEETFLENNIYLYDNLANQLSVAVANILANEEILEREKEKTNLLSISEAISYINSSNELLKVIYEKIRPVFPFDSAGLLITDEATDTVYEILNGQAFPDELQKKLRAENLLGPWKLSLSNPQSWWMKNEIVINSMQQEALLTKGYVGEGQFEEGINHGLLHMIGGPMLANSKKIGAICFNSKDPNFYSVVHSSMFKSISEQIGVAISNILANEEIVEREKEKTQLLEITKLIASVKSTEQLLKVIVENIKPLFNFHDCGLFVVDADGKTHTDLAAVLPGVSPSEWNEKIASISSKIPHKGSVIEWAMNEIDKKNAPVLFDFKDLVARFPTYPQMDGTGLLEMGYRDCLGINLKVRGQSIGWFCINALQKDFFTEKQFPLFQSVAHSISIAVANIIANEEILEREREKTLLLSISNEIAQIRDLNTLVTWVRQKAAEFLHFDFLTLTLTCQQKNTVHYVWGDDDAEWQQKEGGRARKGLVNSGIAYKGSFFEHVDLLQEGTVYTIKNLDKSLPGLPQKWAAHCGIKQSFLVKLIYKGAPIGNISFHSNKKGMFDNIIFCFFKISPIKLPSRCSTSSPTKKWLSGSCKKSWK